VEHEELVAMLNELASTPRRWLLRRPSQGVEDPALLAWIDAMQAWAESHFATEERLMQAFSYPDYERHQGAHRTLVDEIRDIRAALESREIAVDSWLVQRLRDWWQRHTERADAPLGQFIAEQGPADTDLNRG
jgi:hemerythrin